MTRLLLLVAPLLSGAGVMALELVGLRLLAPHFGASTYVWGGLLGAIMAALAVGYLLGGAVADRRPQSSFVFALLLASAAWVIVDLAVAERVLDLAERQGAGAGPILATAILLGPPMLLLGSVSPYVVRLEGRLPSLGVTAGRVFALSTAGSLGGTFATAFWLIPTVGCRQTLRLLVVALVVAGVSGLAWPASRAARAALALAAALLPFRLADEAPPPGTVFAGESPYNGVYVQDQDGVRFLRLNDPRRGFHSVRLDGSLLTGAYYDVLYLGPLLAQGRQVLVLGVGGGTTVRAYRLFYPGVHVTAVEIDPLVVRVGRELMGMYDGPDLEVRVADARPFLRSETRRFDFVEADLFAGGPYAPFYCLTAEFFASVRDRLRPTGLVALNVYAPDGDPTLVSAVAATLRTVFPSVLELPLAEESVLLGFRRPVSADEISERLLRSELPGDLAAAAREVASALRPAAAGGPVLRDDLAPVEQLTHAMLERHRRAPPPSP
jgi:spermidine synthase